TRLGGSISSPSSIHAVETNPDPLPFTKGEGNLRWHRVGVTEQGSKTGAFQLSSPRWERGEDQGEGRFQRHTYVSGEFRRDEFLQLERVSGEKADAFGQLFRGHRVFVEHPAEGLFVQRQFRILAVGGRGFRAQLARERAGGLLHFFKQRRADGQQIATGQLEHFANVAETGAHDFSRV